MHSVVPIGAIILYLVLILLVLYVASRATFSIYPYAVYVLVALLALFLARMVSTHYVLDEDSLHAWRLFGTRRIRLADIRSIELTSLRDLGPAGFFGTWGWRGRTWSPSVGPFDAIYTVSFGLLVKAGPVPLFFSPRDREGFARELSRRVRSYRDSLESDAGAPARAAARPA
jgi:hypothetical protein